MFVDRLASRAVSAGGFFIILSILAILVVIVAQAYPLFRKPSSRELGAIGLPAATLVAGADEYGEVAYVVESNAIRYVSFSGGAAPADTTKLPATITAVSDAGAAGHLALGFADGRAASVSARFTTSYAGKQRAVLPDFEVGEPLVLHTNGTAVTLLARAETPDGPLFVSRVAPHRLAVVAVQESTSLMGDVKRDVQRSEIDLPPRGDISALVVDGRGDFAFVGTTRGELLQVDLRDRAAPALINFPVPATHDTRTGITALGLLIGHRTLVVGDASGRVTSWQCLQKGREARLVRMNDFDPHATAVVGFAASPRNKGFVTVDASGSIALHYGTTGATLLRIAPPGGAHSVVFAPKGDGLVAVCDGALRRWTLDNPHPEITLKSLFGKVSYEGYEKPGLVWQSTGGTDDVESKFSLTPLIFGTLKGTFYALFFAVPIALLAALYASQFMHPSLKQWIKPVVEIMAALPSVVIGFIAGLWLAPAMERMLPAIVMMPFVICTAILAALAVWKSLPRRISGRLRGGWEILLLVPVVLLGGWLALQLGGGFEQWALGGDYRLWISRALGLTYDQRNSMVVGLAMGFAVIPVVFTIAEDSLSSVPNHLRAASLALGATPWQTAVRVILPTASPGIFSAIMIGLGRAVGETMIVLMATGNTALMDWSPFNGFRALSANIAVELPEAPEGGTLFRVLFLAALLLYLMTFTLNTVAELVRLRLRKKFRYL